MIINTILKFWYPIGKLWQTTICDDDKTKKNKTRIYNFEQKGRGGGKTFFQPFSTIVFFFVILTTFFSVKLSIQFENHNNFYPTNVNSIEIIIIINFSKSFLLLHLINRDEWKTKVFFFLKKKFFNVT